MSPVRTAYPKAVLGEATIVFVEVGVEVTEVSESESSDVAVGEEEVVYKVEKEINEVVFEDAG